MGQLEDLQVFVRVVDAGGIGRAATQLGMAKSAVSRRLSEPEARLGLRLINRTTRKSNLTEAGRAYYQRAGQVLDDVAERHISQYGYDMVIAATGAVGGSPLANIATQSQLESLKYWPGAECASGDGAPYDTFIPLSAF